MMLRETVLVGRRQCPPAPALEEAQPLPSELSRKRRSYARPKGDEKVLWWDRPGGDGERVQVFCLSPDPDKPSLWLRADDLEKAVAKHIREGGAFANRKGNALARGALGQKGWLKPLGSRRREYHVHDGQKWVPAARPREAYS